MKRYVYRLLAGAAALAFMAPAASAQELTIFWAEWDPANYLQELVNEYEAETGVTVTVETTPWQDFQTKAFTEFNARGSAYDMIVGDSQWLGAASEGGHYVDLTEFFQKHDLGNVMAPATVKYYAEYPGNSGKYWAIPAEGDAVGWSYRKDWFEDPEEMKAFEAKYGYPLAVPETWQQLLDIAEFFHRPDQNRYGIAIYTDNSYDGLVMGVENALFSYGAELGNYETYEVEGILNSDKAVAALEAYRQLYQYTPPGWSKTFFVENNQAITEGLAAMSMNYFAFFPALVNPATNPNAANTGRSGRRPVCRARRSGHLDRLLLQQYRRELQVPRVVHPGRRAKALGRTGRLHGACQDSRKPGVPAGHPVQRGLLPDHVQGEGLLGCSGICGASDGGQPAHLPLCRRWRGHGEGSPGRACPGLGRYVQEIRPHQVTG